jgi:hypothetical protein
MEYRKKNLKPKKGIALNLKATINNDQIVEEMDFFQQFRK